jgi:hypothetical protein
MSWFEFHSSSEEHAMAAENALRRGDIPAKLASLVLAAQEEERALACVDATEDPRTMGNTALSATALWFHARHYENAQRVGHSALANPRLPEFARREIREILSATEDVVNIMKAKPYRHIAAAEAARLAWFALGVGSLIGAAVTWVLMRMLHA